MIRNNRGLSLVEVLIALVAMSALVVTLILFLTNYWRFSMYQQADLDSLTQRLNTGDYLRENISTSNGLITQNSIADSNVSNVDPGDMTGLFWLKVHAVPQTIAMPATGQTAPVIYYKQFSTAQDKSLIYNGSLPYEDEYILYLDGASKELRVRSLVNPNTTATNHRQTSCPPALATSTCPKDITLISGVASIEKRFFSRSGNLIDWTSIYDSDIGDYIGPDNPAVEVMELTINVASKATFQKSNTTQNSTVIRIALRNT